MHLAHGSGTLVELCIDGQAETIVIGPDGAPRPALGHDCTECLLIAGFDRPSLGLASPHDPVPRALAFRPSTKPAQRGATLAAAHARAPPVVAA